jgi:hypothetical protein
MPNLLLLVAPRLKKLEETSDGVASTPERFATAATSA